MNPERLIFFSENFFKNKMTTTTKIQNNNDQKYTQITNNPEEYSLTCSCLK